MLRLDAETPIIAAHQETYAFMYDATTQSFCVAGSTIDYENMGRHPDIDSMPVQTVAPSPVRITRNGSLLVATELHDWINDRPDVLRDASDAMQKAYNSMLQSRHPKGAAGFNAGLKMQQRSQLLGIILCVPDFAALGPGDTNEHWTRYVFNRQAASSAQRVALRAGLGHVAHQMVATRL